MKTIYTDDLFPLLRELELKSQQLLDEYQIKSGLNKDTEIRLNLSMDKSTDKVVVILAIRSLGITLAERNSPLKERG